MRNLLTKLAVAGAVLTLSAPATSAPAYVRAAIATAQRSADNVKLDASRKPAQLLAFLGLRKGAQVLDLVGANRYWAEIMAPAIGSGGRITVWQPSQFLQDKDRAAFDAFAAKHSNVSLITSPFEAPNFAVNAYDFALINLDYHDVYWTSDKFKIVRMEPQAWLKTLRAAMKPGATVGVVDHVADAGSDPRVSVEATHRIDPAVVKADFKRAGFVLVGESNLLRNPADDRKLGVFDPKIRGRTDRVVLKFRKPSR